MAMYKDQMLDFKYLILLVYTINNYCNIYFENFVLDPIQIKYLKSSVSYLALLV